MDHYPLDATIQLIPHPLNSAPIKSICLQFREKDVVEDHVKVFTNVQIDDILLCSIMKKKIKTAFL